MTITSREARAARIESAHAEVTLLLALVTQQRAKDELASANRDIAEATRLNQEDVDADPATIKIVNSILDLAESRIGRMRAAVAQAGSRQR